MLSIKFETSERGDTLNWVKDIILKNKLGLLSFEGYTVKNSLVSLLLDRGCFQIDCANINEKELFDTLLNISQFHLKEKIEFSKKLKCHFLFFCYSYLNEKTSIFALSEKEASLLKQFRTYREFAEWTTNYRDLVMKAAYEESGLPNIDVALRKLGIPWPGNLDYVLLKEQVPVALIEFQRTAKLPVKDHCNNTWFLPSGYRKGDVNRWRAIDIIRKQSKLPLFVIVWSTKEKCIKLKLVEKIVYPEDAESVKGLRYKSKEIMSVERMIEILKRY